MDIVHEDDVAAPDGWPSGSVKHVGEDGLDVAPLPVSRVNGPEDDGVVHLSGDISHSSVVGAVGRAHSGGALAGGVVNGIPSPSHLVSYGGRTLTGEFTVVLRMVAQLVAFSGDTGGDLGMLIHLGT